jgi:hypothetical protein
MQDWEEGRLNFIQISTALSCHNWTDYKSIAANGNLANVKYSLNNFSVNSATIYYLAFILIIICYIKRNTVFKSMDCSEY